jgi:hypothetical protein
VTATYKTSSQVEPLARAARTVDRWGLVAGVTGFLGNVLLAVLLTTPADGPYAWTGPANDVIGVVSTLAIIPVVAGLLTVCGNRRGLGAVTALAIVALLAMAAVELAFVLGLVPFAAESDGTFAGLIVVFGWLFAASRAGRTSGRLPRQVASCGAALGAAGLAGAVLLVASVSTPAHPLAHAVTFGAGALISGPVYAAFPVWLIVLSYRLPGHAGSPGQLV